MSLNSRINEMETHIGDIYDELEVGGADLTNVDKNIININPQLKDRMVYYLNNGLEEVWDNWEKTTGSGTQPTINNTEEAPMKLVYKGNTSQNGTPTPSSPIPVQVVSGDNSIKVEEKNLFDKNNLNTLVAYIPANGTITPANGNYMVWFKIAQNTDFAISLTQIAKSTSPYVDDIQIGLYQNTPVLNATGTRIYSGTRPSATEDYTYTYSFNSGANNYIAIKVANNDRTDATATLNTLQLEKGNQATTYEAYKGASYPISLGDKELCKIGTYQDKINKSTGKNLFDIDNLTFKNGYYNFSGTFNNANNNGTFEFINANPNTTYTFSVNNSMASIVVCEFNEAKTFITRTVIQNKTNATITTNSSTKYLAITINKDGTIAITKDLTKSYQPMLEKNNQTTSYEPYGTSWYLKKEIGKVVLNGSENWTQSGQATNTYRFALSQTLLQSNTEGYCNTNNFVTSGVSADTQLIGISGGTIYYRISTSLLTALDVTQFKNWLANNNSIVYAPLITPTYETITDTTLLSQLEALKKSYEGQTNIFQTNNGLPFELDITALSK